MITMKFIQTGTFRENYLAEIIDINHIEKIPDVLLDKLDYLIGFIAKQEPEKIQEYVTNLTKKYNNLIEEDLLNL